MRNEIDSILYQDTGDLTDALYTVLSNRIHNYLDPIERTEDIINRTSLLKQDLESVENRENLKIALVGHSGVISMLTADLESTPPSYDHQTARFQTPESGIFLNNG